MKRIALAVEVEVPDDIDPLDQQVVYVTLLRPDGFRMGVGTPHQDLWGRWPRIVRAEIHPDPDAIFAPEGEA